MTAEIIEVIRTELKTSGDGDKTPIHRHEQFWSTDGELLAENCKEDHCTQPIANEGGRTIHECVACGKPIIDYAAHHHHRHKELPPPRGEYGPDSH